MRVCASSSRKGSHEKYYNMLNVIWVLQLLVGLVTAYRYEGPEVDANLAKTEAKTLKNAIDGKAYNHEEVVRIVTTRSKAQLRATFNRYKDDYNKFITKASLSLPNTNLFLSKKKSI